MCVKEVHHDLTCPEWVSKNLKSNLRIVDFPANKRKDIMTQDSVKKINLKNL